MSYAFLEDSVITIHPVGKQRHCMPTGWTVMQRVIPNYLPIYHRHVGPMFTQCRTWASTIPTKRQHWPNDSQFSGNIHCKPGDWVIEWLIEYAVFTRTWLRYIWVFLLSQIRLSSVCLSVTLVHPTQRVEPFGNFLHRCVPWPSSDLREKFTVFVWGTPPSGTLNARRVAK